MDDPDFHPGHKALWSLISYRWSPYLGVVFCVCSPPGNVTSTPFSSCLEHSDHHMPLVTRGCCHQIGAWHSRPFSLHFHTYIFNDNTILDFFFFYRNGILPHTASCGLPVFYLIIRLGIFPWLDLLLTHILFIASWWSKLDTLCFICLPRCMSMQITPQEVLLL